MSATTRLSYAKSVALSLSMDCRWWIGQTVYVLNDPTVTDELQTVGVVVGLRYIGGAGWQLWIDANEEPARGYNRAIPSHEPGMGDVWNQDDPDLSATPWPAVTS